LILEKNLVSNNNQQLAAPFKGDGTPAIKIIIDE